MTAIIIDFAAFKAARSMPSQVLPAKPSAPAQRPYVAYTDPKNVVVGSKYDSKTSVKEDAVSIRNDIKEAVKAGTIPKGFKFSVRVDSYSMGQSLYVTVTEVPAGFVMNNVEFRRAYVVDPLGDGCRRLERYTREASNLLSAVDEIVHGYNRKNVDSSSDFYDVKFSFHGADFGSLGAQEETRMTAAIKKELEQ